MKVMLAVDVHDEPEHILALAMPILENLRASVDLLYVSEARTQIPAGSGSDPAYALWQKDRSEEQAIMDRLMASLPEGIRGAVRIHPGEPRTALPYLSGEYELVVTGTHSRRALARLVLGSVADHLVRNARCPVTILRTSLPER